MDKLKEGKASQKKLHIKMNESETVEVDSNRPSSQLKKVEDCTLINKMNEGSDECVQTSNKSIQKIGTLKDEATMDEDVRASKRDFNNIKAATQDKQKIFEKRCLSGIAGQLYQIYLVVLILLYGLTNEKVTHFHLASNLKEAGDFDDVVFSYTYKDLNGAEKIKVTFLKAKHIEKTRSISLEALLGKTRIGSFDLKKYFRSFCKIKKNFERGDSADPIFGRDFEECEFIIYTNALFKVGHTEKVYIKELLAEEDWILNVKGEKIKYYQLRFSENKNDMIKTFLGSIEESEEQDFREFLSKLKIFTAQPNHDQLKQIIKEEIQFHYGVTRSDIQTVFPVVKNKIEAWWKNSNEYLTEKNTIIQSAVRFSIRFEVQDPVPGFTGREQSLRDLHKALQSTGHSVISQSASITGLGGIGKTELARKYVSQYGQDYDNNVIWIDAETYSTSSESFRRLARDALGIGIKTIDGEDEDITCIISEVYAFFAKHNKKSLFIFDNAENPQDGATAKVAENVTSFLPSGDNKSHVLITSRNQHWVGIQSLQLDLFTEEESAQFINKYLSERRIKCEESEIKSLGEILQYLPLALRQAVAYIAMENEKLQKLNKSYTIGSYLKEFEDKARQFLGKAPQDVFDTYAKTVLTTWEVTIEKIKQSEKYGMDSELILNIIAFFSPNNIPIITIFESLISKKKIRGCVEILEEYSLVQLQDGEVSIHRLLQQVIRIILKKKGKYIDVLERTLRLFHDDISSNCIIHVRSVWDYAKDLNNVVENYSWVPLLITRKLVDANKYTDAYSTAMRTYELFKDVLGDSHPDTVTCLNWKGDILCKQGNYNPAELIFEEILCKRYEILGPDHPETLSTMRNLASVRNEQGKYEKSLILYQEVWCRQKQILGPDHPETITTKYNIPYIKINEGSDECVQTSNKSIQKIGTLKDETNMDEDVKASKRNFNNIKAATQDKQKIFEKSEFLGGIAGQLYQIYLVVLILLYGLTNKKVTHFHLASNLKEAGDFDDVVFSYTYKDLNGAEKIKVTFLEAKHKEKTKSISLEALLGKTRKGSFYLKKYFRSFRKIKKNFERGDSADPIFGSDFEECEFIIYTNALLKIDNTDNIKEQWAEEDWILNVKGERIKYYQLRFSENKNDMIKTFVGSIEESEEQDFREFLSKLKIFTAQPNQDQLKQIIKEEIQFRYGVTRSDIETVFPVVKNKIEDWWKNSSEYLTEKATIIQNAARFSIRFEVQDPVPGFTGREQLLRDLHKALQSRGHSEIAQSALITGLGGIGKTELARKYVSQYSQHYDNNVIWINAETYSTTSESFRRLAGDALGIGIKTIDGEDKDITCIISEVYAFFANRNKKSLFIFDNADGATAKDEENVKNFLPSGDNKPHVLITSRTQYWGGIHSLQLDLLTEEESAKFINKYLSERRIKCEESEIKSLGEILQYLPLALRQAVAYIAMENEKLQKLNDSYTIGNYLKVFEDNAKKLLGKDPQDVYDTYDKTVLTTWKVTIEKIKQHEKYGMDSELILNIIAFFSPDNIPIITIFESLISKKKIRGAVEILEKYSLVQLQDREVSIHRLLQLVLRIMLQNEKKYEDVMKKTLRLFNDDISSNCIIHARFAWDYAKNLSNLVENFSWVPLLIISKLVDAFKYTDAYPIVIGTYTLFKDVLGDSHPDTVKCLHWKENIVCRQENYDAAELVSQ